MAFGCDRQPFAQNALALSKFNRNELSFRGF